jgi:hypothetical protein
MKIFDYIRRILKRNRKNRKALDTTISTKGFTTASQYFTQPRSQPVITFSYYSKLPDSAHQLINKTVVKIDEKSISDYEFREWLRDNLSSCEYHSENGPCKYAKPDDTRPISVIDAMLEVK